MINKFTYFGSTINGHCTHNNEISARVKKAMDTFTVLEEYQRGINKFAKMALYNLMCADMPGVLICEIGCVRQTLRLRSNLGIHWIIHTPVTLILGKANTISIEGHIATGFPGKAKSFVLMC